MSLKFDKIRTRTTELPALERPKIDVATIFSAVFHPTLFIFTGNDDMHDSLEISQYTFNGKTVLPLFLSCFDRIFFTLACNIDKHKNLDAFGIREDPTTDHRVSCPLASKIVVATFSRLFFT